jgi:hypothetical protein
MLSHNEFTSYNMIVPAREPGSATVEIIDRAFDVLAVTAIFSKRGNPKKKPLNFRGFGLQNHIYWNWKSQPKLKVFGVSTGMTTS